MIAFLLCFLLLSVAYGEEEIKPDGIVIEGDMVVSEKQAEAINEGRNPDGADSRSARDLSSYSGHKWPRATVPYVLGSGIVLWKKLAVHNAMKEISEKTCIKFVERTNQRDYVEFVSFKGGCWSYVGRTGGKQLISLSFGCITRGIAIHEICHALGLYHEQSRPDRDDYVTIHWDNIQEDQKHNFRKYSRNSINSLGSPYDYNSIMHYGSKDFSKFPFVLTTVEPKQPGAKIGQRRHLSQQDTIQLNLFYCR